MTDKILMCPNCGCIDGAYSVFVGHQHYALDGKDEGFNIEDGGEKPSLRCVACEKIIGRIVNGKPQFFEPKRK